MKKEKTCGVIVFKRIEREIFILMVQHNAGHWGMPKGHVEGDETEYETALREVYEETGIKAKIIDGFRTVITYSPKNDVIKDVVFFVGCPINDCISAQIDEVSKVEWVNIGEVYKLIQYNDVKNIIDDAVNFYSSLEN